MAVDSTGNHEGLTPMEELRESKQDELTALVRKAEAFLESRSWCRRVLKGRLDIEWGRLLGVFLFVIEPESPDIPDSVWVVAGDLPPGCVQAEGNPNGACALETHAARLQEWVDRVFLERPVRRLIEVNVPPDAEWAMQLQSRLRIIRTALKREYAQELAKGGGRNSPRLVPEISAARKRVLARLKKRSIETNPFAREISVLVLRSPEEVAKKIIVRSMMGAPAKKGAELGELDAWIARRGLSEEIERGPEDPRGNGEFVRPLLWAGGILRYLEFPSSRRSPKRLFSLIPPEVPTGSFIESFRLRRADEIRYQTDLHYCLAWTVVNSGGSLEELLGGRADPEVVVERNRAFQWLTAGSRWEKPKIP